MAKYIAEYKGEYHTVYTDSREAAMNLVQAAFSGWLYTVPRKNIRLKKVGR